MTRIFMFSHLPVLSQGVEILLSKEQGVDIVGRETNVEQALVRIREQCPDVVILDGGLQASDAATVAMRILETVKTKVIGLELEDNTISIYRRDQKSVHSIGDLMAAIEDDRSPFKERGAD
jgi:DNA-binding NarL/FixJ family response regulator